VVNSDITRQNRRSSCASVAPEAGSSIGEEPQTTMIYAGTLRSLKLMVVSGARRAADRRLISDHRLSLRQSPQRRRVTPANDDNRPIYTGRAGSDRPNSPGNCAPLDGFLTRDAMLARYMLWARVSVSVSVNVEFKVTLHEQVRYRGTLQN